MLYGGKAKFVFAEKIHLPADIVFINQIRGEECCDVGSLENVKIQANAFIENSLPAYFTLRYDALNDPNYMSYIKSTIYAYPNLFRLGVLFEITPQFADDSSVKYHGKIDQWYEAQNVFSIGYSHDDSKKLVDTLYKKFFDEFGYYPEIVTSWMIDSTTLHYITDTYKTRLFQITREQWGQDSYTLYGGPIHFPYPASRNWVFIPDYSRTDAPLIIRQTVTDPLRNYGDRTSAFTSQPNDYMRDKKTFDYFTGLINQAVDQQPKGFANIGLENSMDLRFQTEYVKQIQYIKKLVDEKKAQLPGIDDILQYWKKQKSNIYSGVDLVKHSNTNAYWISTPYYRARLRDFGSTVAITDFRLFDRNFEDPYVSSPAKKQGFWIVPYLIDGSRDEKSRINSISLPDKKSAGVKIQAVNGNDAIELRYTGKTGKTIIITFETDGIAIAPALEKEILYDNHNSSSNPVKYQKTNQGFMLKWILGNQTLYSLISSCLHKVCRLTPKVFTSDLKEARMRQYPYLFPEPIDRKIDTAKTLIYAHNQYAIAERNPARIIVIPYDQYGIALKLSEPIEVNTQPPTRIATSTSGLMQYIDIMSDVPRKVDVKIKIKGSELKKVTVYLTVNCSKEFMRCLTEPKLGWWYINSFLGDKYRQFFLGEKQS